MIGYALGVDNHVSDRTGMSYLYNVIILDKSSQINVFYPNILLFSISISIAAYFCSN